MEAKIISGEGSRTVRVRDLSRGGVQIICDEPPAQGCELIFCRGSVFVAAQVVWQEAGRAGLEFYTRVDPDEHGAEWR